MPLFRVVDAFVMVTAGSEDIDEKGRCIPAVIVVKHDTSTSYSRVSAGKPVGKHSRDEYGWHLYSFPTGRRRVRVKDLRCTSSYGYIFYFILFGCPLNYYQ